MAQAPKPAEAPKPKSRTMLLAVIIVVILVVVGVGVYILTRPPASSNNGVPVKIFDGTGGACTSAANCGFNPTTITIKLGTNATVTWTNTGGQAHTVTSNSTANGNLPSFDSGRVDLNQQYTHTFTQAGTYYYSCTYHPWMKGTVVVTS